MLELEEKLKECDISLHSVKETLDTSTAIGRTVFQMLGLVSEWERESIIERTKSGRIQRYKEGCWAGGKPPYGYSYNKETKKLVINPTESRVAKRIFQDYKLGKSLRAIANTLNQEGISSRSNKGKYWRATAIRNMLINPVYKGMLIVNRHVHISDIAKVNMSKAITIPVPEIVTEQDWNIAQNRLAGNKSIRPMQENWLLQGLIRCGLCGRSFRTEKIHNRRYYECRGKLKANHLDGTPRCTARRLRAEWVEQQVWQRIEEVINNPNKLKPLLEDTIDNLKSREEELKARIMPIDEQLLQIAKKKAKLADDWVQTNMDAEKFKELQQSLNKEEVRLKSIRNEIDPAQIQELESTRGLLCFWQKRLVDDPHKTVLTLVGLEDKNTSNIMHFPADRRGWLDLLQVRLVVFLDRIEIKAVYPIQPIDYQKCTSTYKGRGDDF